MNSALLQIRCMHFFPCLRTLFLVQQNISEIEGLTACPTLEARASLRAPALVNLLREAHRGPRRVDICLVMT